MRFCALLNIEGYLGILLLQSPVQGHILSAQHTTKQLLTLNLENHAWNMRIMYVKRKPSETLIINALALGSYPLILQCSWLNRAQ